MDLSVLIVNRKSVATNWRGDGQLMGQAYVSGMMNGNDERGKSEALWWRCCR